MRGFRILLRRELTALLHAPVAYILFVFFHALMGFSVWYLIRLMVQRATGAQVLQEVFGSLFFWLVNLLIIPPLTMRVLAEEKKEGTLETLMTAPVTDQQVVAAKFFGCWIAYLILWVPTLMYGPLIARLSPNPFVPDFGSLAAAYVGVAGIGAVFVSLGVLCSSFTRNQVVAAVMCFTLMALMFLAGFVPYVAPPGRWVDLLSYFSLVQHMDDARLGFVDTRTLVAHGSATLFFLFCATRSVEARRWR